MDLDRSFWKHRRRPSFVDNTWDDRWSCDGVSSQNWFSNTDPLRVLIAPHTARSVRSERCAFWVHFSGNVNDNSRTWALEAQAIFSNNYSVCQWQTVAEGLGDLGFVVLADDEYYHGYDRLEWERSERVVKCLFSKVRERSRGRRGYPSPVPVFRTRTEVSIVPHEAWMTAQSDELEWAHHEAKAANRRRCGVCGRYGVRFECESETEWASWTREFGWHLGSAKYLTYVAKKAARVARRKEVAGWREARRVYVEARKLIQGGV